MEKAAKFVWTDRREDSYQALLRILSDKTTLRPFRPDLPTHFISDACRQGLAASVYQEERDGTRVPVTTWTGLSPSLSRAGSPS